MYSRHKCFQLPVVEFQSTRLSRASTPAGHQQTKVHGYFNPQGSHEPRQQKYTIILASMPNLYILIIHLQQIIQQVKKISRILILFSGRLQCETPGILCATIIRTRASLLKINPLLNYLHYPYVLNFPVRS